MTDQRQGWKAADQERLQRELCTDLPKWRWVRHANLLLPSNPRCRGCLRPFAGFGGRLLRLSGYRPSRMNPNWCNSCYDRLPIGGVEVDTGILFVDIRGYTAMAASETPEETAARVNRFYGMATNILWHHDAFISKFVGDEVMALFQTNWAGDGLFHKIASSAEELLRGAGYGSPEGAWLPIGIGVDYGLAFVGNVGAGETKDWTAIGDVVNTAARLQAEAKPGQIVMSERMYREIQKRFPGAIAVTLSLKGKSEPVPARVIDLNQGSLPA